jgi:hypothetical protein
VPHLCVFCKGGPQCSLYREEFDLEEASRAHTFEFSAKGGSAEWDRSAAFEIFEPAQPGLNFGVQRAKSRGIALLTQFDGGCALVKLGQQRGFNLL